MPEKQILILDLGLLISGFQIAKCGFWNKFKKPLYKISERPKRSNDMKILYE
jgi:hypothetical protein